MVTCGMDENVLILTSKLLEEELVTLVNFIAIHMTKVRMSQKSQMTQFYYY